MSVSLWLNRYSTLPLFFTYFKNATHNAESVQDKMNLVVKRNAKNIAVKELIHSLPKLRDKENEKRQKVDRLQQMIRKRTTKMLRYKQ